MGALIPVRKTLRLNKIRRDAGQKQDAWPLLGLWFRPVHLRDTGRFEAAWRPCLSGDGQSHADRYGGNSGSQTSTSFPRYGRHEIKPGDFLTVASQGFGVKPPVGAVIGAEQFAANFLFYTTAWNRNGPSRSAFSIRWYPQSESARYCPWSPNGLAGSCCLGFPLLTTMWTQSLFNFFLNAQLIGFVKMKKMN